MGSVKVVPVRTPDVGVIELAGEHDDRTAPEIATTIADVLAAGKNVVIDLSDTCVLEPTALAALLEARRAAHSAERGFVVQWESGSQVHALFERIDDAADLRRAYSRREAVAMARVDGARLGGAPAR
jgi:anti-anti-sigma regulatory factor